MAAQEGDIAQRQIGPGLDPQRGHLLGPAWTDPEKAPDWQSRDKRRAFAGADHTQPIGFVLIAGKFGEEFIVRHPGAGGQPGLALDPRPDQFGNPHG